jgi:hypothetical protein
MGDVPQISTNPTLPLPPLSFLPTRLPYCVSIQLRVYPHGYPYSTVRLYSGLDANDSHLRFMQ